MESPALMKPVADKAFCDGLNWFFMGSTATHAGMDTPGDENPGGVHFNREVTWWPQARPMVDYFARCSYLLQQGLFVADVCYYNGDEAPNFVGPKSVDPALGTGYDYDVCNAEVLLRRMAVRDGRIVLPDGMSYRLLVLPEREGMPVEVVSKLHDLVAAGATVVGPKPQRDTGLKDYPRCDREVQRLADELWGDCDGKTVCQHRFGKGRIVWGVKLRNVLRADGVPPDFEYSAGKESYLDFLHRTAEGAEIYFVANRTAHEETARCTFRTSGKLPELWDPVGGAMRNAANYTIAGGPTTLPLMLPPNGSIFIVFRRPAPAARAEGRNFPVFQPVQELSGPWTVHFDPKWGGPETVRFSQLISWTERPEAGVKFYSGTATYRRRFDLPESLRLAGQDIYLDLGSVRDVAEVRLNGRDLGVVWTAPWRVDITGAVRPADNVLEVRITNLWPNRLIGDAALPAGKCVAHTNVRFDKDHPLLPSGLLGPVWLMTAHDRKCKLIMNGTSSLPRPRADPSSILELLRVDGQAVVPIAKAIMRFRVDRVPDQLDRAIAHRHVKPCGVGAAELAVEPAVAGGVLHGHAVGNLVCPAVHIIVVAARPTLIIVGRRAIGVMVGHQVSFAQQVGVAGAVGNIRHPAPAMAADHAARAVCAALAARPGVLPICQRPVHPRRVRRGLAGTPHKAAGVAGAGGVVAPPDSLRRVGPRKVFKAGAQRVWIRDRLAAGRAMENDQRRGDRLLAAAQIAARSEVVQRLLLDIGKDVELPAARLLSVEPQIGIAKPTAPPAAGRQKPVRLLVVQTSQGELLDIVLALHLACGLTCRLHRRQEQGDKDGDDRDHDQQLDKRKTATRSSGWFLHAFSLPKFVLAVPPFSPI